jgi:hypothetical protein
MDEFQSMTEADLRDALVARELPTWGTKDELLERIRRDIAFAKEIAFCKEIAALPSSAERGQSSLTAVLEEAAKMEGGALTEYLAEVKKKANKVPKFVDVTITSLGLTPEKYTPGGAASATADVLKKLAGEPFADPPQYGSVSQMLGRNATQFSLLTQTDFNRLMKNLEKKGAKLFTAFALLDPSTQ